MSRILALFNPFVGVEEQITPIKTKSASSQYGIRTVSRSSRAAVAGLPAEEQIRFVAGTALVVLTCALLVSYFYSVNQYASTGYEMRQVQDNIAATQEQNKKLVLQLSQQGSLVDLQNELAGRNFIPVTNIHYLKISQFSQR